MKLTIFIVAVISVAIIAVAIMLSFDPHQDFKSDLDDIPINTKPEIKWDLYIETTGADYWEQVKGLNKKKETSEPDTTDVFVTDENGEIVTDEDGEPITETGKIDEDITDENGEIVTDKNGEPATNKKSEDVTDKKGKTVDDSSDNKVSVTDVPKNKKSGSKVTITAD